jgi:hypothetical protein
MRLVSNNRIFQYCVEIWRLIRRVVLRGRSPMTKPDEHHDYLTSSVAGLLTLLIILVGNALVAAWFFYFYFIPSAPTPP